MMTRTERYSGVNDAFDIVSMEGAGWSVKIMVEYSGYLFVVYEREDPL